MAEDPWAAFRKQPAPPQPAPVNGLPTAPLPFPAQGSPKKQREAAKAAEEREFARQQNQRANEAAAREDERLRRDGITSAAKEKALAASGGVDTTVEENKSLGLTSQTIDLAREILRVEKENPEAVNPSLQETVAGWTGSDFIKKAATPEKVRDARINLNNLYSNLVQTAIYNASGAAFQEAERNALLQNFQPDYFDTPNTRASKRRQIGFAIKAGILKSGAASLKLSPEQLQTAAELAEMKFLREMEEADKVLAGEVQADNVTNAAPGVKPSEENTSIKLPPEYQKAYETFLATKRPGELTVDEYVRMRQALDKAYLGEEFQGNPYSDAQKFVDAFNEGKPVTAVIPEPTKEMSEGGKVVADLLNSPGGAIALNYANASAAGLPELLTGKQGRTALAAVNAENPTSALVGDIGGSVVPGVLLERLGTKAASAFMKGPVGSRLIGELGANAGYGAVRGFNNAEEGEGLSAAGGGAVDGTVGTLVARGAMRGIRGFQSSDTAGKINQFLNPPPVVGPKGELTPIPKTDLTTMQRMGLTGVEEAAQGLPFVHGQREKTIGTWNTQNAAKVLGNIGVKLPKGLAPGQETNAVVNQELNNFYNALKPRVKGTVDRSFHNAFSALRAKAVASGSPERKALWKDVEAAVAQFKKGGTFDGNDFREASSRLLEIANVNSKNGDDLAKLDIARLAEKTRTQLIALVARADPQVAKELKAVSKSWAQMKRLETASLSAGAMANRGIAPPDDVLGAIKRLDTSTDKGAVARGKGFMQQEVQDAREVLGSRAAGKTSIKETGIAGYVLGPILALPAALAYAPGLKRLTQAMIDGKLGQTADAISAKAFDDPELAKIPPELMQAAITQYLRAKQMSDTPEEK